MSFFTNKTAPILWSWDLSLSMFSEFYFVWLQSFIKLTNLIQPETIPLCCYHTWTTIISTLAASTLVLYSFLKCWNFQKWFIFSKKKFLLVWRKVNLTFRKYSICWNDTFGVNLMVFDKHVSRLPRYLTTVANLVWNLNNNSIPIGMFRSWSLILAQAWFELHTTHPPWVPPFLLPIDLKGEI
jgi:hypothetical protein